MLNEPWTNRSALTNFIQLALLCALNWSFTVNKSYEITYTCLFGKGVIETLGFWRAVWNCAVVFRYTFLQTYITDKPPYTASLTNNLICLKRNLWISKDKCIFCFQVFYSRPIWREIWYSMWCSPFWKLINSKLWSFNIGLLEHIYSH